MHDDVLPVWRLRQLIDLAYDLSLVGEQVVTSETPIQDAPLFALWQAVRDLADDWQRRIQRLDRHREASWARTWCDDLNNMGHEIFAADMLFRIWGTILVSQEKRHEMTSVRPIVDHVVFHVQHARSRVMELVMHAGEPVAGLDRFRRRCERWTDVLIGPLLARFGVALFAHDSRRAWEFGEELLASENVPGAHQLRVAGFRTAFRENVLNTAATPGWQLIIDAILDGCDVAVLEQLVHWRSAAVIEELPPCDIEITAESLLERCLRIAESREHLEP